VSDLGERLAEEAVLLARSDFPPATCSQWAPFLSKTSRRASSTCSRARWPQSNTSEGDLRAAAVALLDLAADDDDALQEAQHQWAGQLHENPEDGDALGALVLLGAALHLRREQGAQGD